MFIVHLPFSILLFYKIISDSKYFDVSDLGAIAASNIKKVLKMLELYYRTVIKKGVEVESIDVNAITRKCDHDEMINLLELVVGCAVLCENKAKFIQNIFSLDHLSQSILQGMVQRAMDRTYELLDDIGHSISVGSVISSSREGWEVPVEVEGIVTRNGGYAPDSFSDELVRSREIVRHLQEERHRLIQTVSTLEDANSALTANVAELNEKLVANVNERQHIDGSDRNRASQTTQLQTELDESKRELDLKNVEYEGLREKLMEANRRLEAAKSSETQLKMELQQMADELDIAKDKSLRLSKAEATIEKYQRRLEELTEAKKQNKELELKMDQYLDKIHELENSSKNIATMNKLVEQYKDKAVEYEREKFEAVSARQLEQHQNELLTAELVKLKESKRNVEDELSRVRYYVYSMVWVAG